MPLVNNQIPIDPQPSPIVTEDVKPIAATGEVQCSCPTGGEMVGVNGWIWRTIKPFKVDVNIVSH
jgi:hypothetical protein